MKPNGNSNEVSMRHIKRNENGGWKYVRINYQNNTFDNLNKNIILLQSMFAVTFTANRDSRLVISRSYNFYSDILKN